MAINIKELLSQMTVDEKIGQLVQLNPTFFADVSAYVTGPWEELGIDEDFLKNIGSVLGCKNAAEMIMIQEKHMAEDRNKIPMLFMKDVIHGYRTIYPIPLALGASFDPKLVFECTEMEVKEASAGGVHVTFAPMVDYVRDARWGRVLESCGEDPLLNSVMGEVQVRAIQGDNLKDTDHIAGCVKHLAAYGGAESGRDYNTVEISERLLREFYLPAYKACIDAGVAMLMPSFNSLNGMPSIANKWLMQKLLKDEWEFDGVIISDSNAVDELKTHGVAADTKEAAKMAFECGCDIEMMTANYYSSLKSLIDDGTISVSALDEAVERILNLKDSLGLFEDPFRGASPEKEEKICFTDEHRAIARRAAEESTILLKNSGLLPFNKNLKKIALIGPYADSKNILGRWACNGQARDSTSIFEGIQKLLPDAEITVVQGCTGELNETDKSEFAEAVAVARNSDIAVLCIGEPYRYSGEGNSRSEIGLTGLQAELARLVCEANPNTAAVVFGGRPLTLVELDKVCPAILYAWFTGNEGGHAIANLLFGNANPSAKVPMSFPRSVGQCPIYYNHTNTGRPKKSDEDTNRFTSRYIDCGNLPFYSFGHGLSYTKFTYEAMELDANEMTSDGKITVSVTVKNVGDRDGKEVVQLYMHDIVASSVRPVQQLIAFQKVAIKAGETKNVSFEITEPMLRFWNTECNCISEAGEFELFVGYADHPYIKDTFRLI